MNFQMGKSKLRLVTKEFGSFPHELAQLLLLICMQ